MREEDISDLLLIGGIGALSIYYAYLKLKKWGGGEGGGGEGGGEGGGGEGGGEGGGGGGGQPPVTYNVYVYVRPEFWGTTNPRPGTYEVESGSMFEIEAIETSDQYIFDRWEVTIGNKTQTYYDKSISVIVADNTMIIAYFKKAPEPEKYIVSIGVVPPGSGFTYPNVGDYTYEAGTQLNITAHALENYGFRVFEVIEHSSSSDGIILGANLLPHGSISLTVNSHCTVNAHFMHEQAMMYQNILIVRTDPLNEECTKPLYGRYNVDTGSQVTLEADNYTRDYEWVFEEWLIITPLTSKTYKDRKITIDIVDDTLAIARYVPTWEGIPP